VVVYIAPGWVHVCVTCSAHTFLPLYYVCICCLTHAGGSSRPTPHSCAVLPAPAPAPQRPRVLTPSLSAAAAARGLTLLALDPSSTPQQWMEAGVDVVVHKVPDEPGGGLGGCACGC
jgi:hypothetical protein